MRVLVTGTAGFLGFHLARALAARADVTVTGVDNFVRGEDDAAYRALGEAPNVTLIAADLADPAAVASLPDDVDYVYHLAAMNGTQNFYERPMDMIRACTLPTIHLVDHFGRQATPLKRMIYAGTSESYASTVSRFAWPVPTAEDVPLCIDDVTNPRCPMPGRRCAARSRRRRAGAASASPSSSSAITTLMGREWATSMWCPTSCADARRPVRAVRPCRHPLVPLRRRRGSRHDDGRRKRGLRRPDRQHRGRGRDHDAGAGPADPGVRGDRCGHRPARFPGRKCQAPHPTSASSAD